MRDPNPVQDVAGEKCYPDAHAGRGSRARALASAEAARRRDSSYRKLLTALFPSDQSGHPLHTRVYLPVAGGVGVRAREPFRFDRGFRGVQKRIVWQPGCLFSTSSDKGFFLLHVELFQSEESKNEAFCGYVICAVYPIERGKMRKAICLGREAACFFPLPHLRSLYTFPPFLSNHEHTQSSCR